MKLNIQNAKNETVGALELNDEVFGGRVKTDLIWASVVQQNAAERRGTHATKNRALVSGGGKKPYKQKGTGRPQVGSSRTPLWRKGGTVFGPQPRSYETGLPKKVRVPEAAHASGRSLGAERDSRMSFGTIRYFCRVDHSDFAGRDFEGEGTDQI